MTHKTELIFYSLISFFRLKSWFTLDCRLFCRQRTTWPRHVHVVFSFPFVAFSFLFRLLERKQLDTCWSQIYFQGTKQLDSSFRRFTILKPVLMLACIRTLIQLNISKSVTFEVTECCMHLVVWAETAKKTEK